MTVRWRAPGRVNLIGEHTDYNEGFALPFAIDAACTATASHGADGVVRIASAQRDRPVEVKPADLGPGAGEWASYPAGVVWALRELGAPLDGVDLTVDSTVPSGAGLSSSAAL
ncbi:MAG: galactokinase family protein, partial [Jatrophihabitantaceae bacterium]